MRAPTDDALIAEGRKPLGPPTEVTLGQVARLCKGCGRDWDRPDRCSHCGSFEFEEKVIRPKGMVLLSRGITAAVAEPPEPSVLAETADLDALRHLRQVLAETERSLVEADAVARRLVNQNSTNFKVFSHIQEVLNLMSTPGDFEIVVANPLKAVGLRQMVHALIGEIDKAIRRFEEMQK